MSRDRKRPQPPLLYRLLRRNDQVRRWLLRQFTPIGLGVLCCMLTAGLIGLDIKRSLSYQVFALLAALLVVAIVYGWVWTILHHKDAKIARRLRRPARFSATRYLPRFGTVGMPLQYRVVLHNASHKRQEGLTLQETFADAFPSFEDFQRVFKRERKDRRSFRLRKQSVKPDTLKQQNSLGQRQSWLKLLSRSQWAIAPSITLPALVAKGDTEIISELVPLHRGRLAFQPLTITRPDPLGLVNCRISVSMSQAVSLSMSEAVLILPNRYQLPTIDLPGSRRFQAGNMAMASAVGESEEFRALREYRPGDPIRKIHWKSWAKTGRPIVKEEQTEFSVRHALVLDTFVGDREQNLDMMEEAVAIAASFACSIQADGQAQGSLLDMVFVGAEPGCFTVGAGAGHAEQLLELLAAIAPCENRGFESLLPVVQQQLALLSGCICVLLRWDDDRQALVEQLQAAGVPTLVLLLAEADGLAEPPDMSWVRVPKSRLHVLQMGDIQSGLLALGS